MVETILDKDLQLYEEKNPNSGNAMAIRLEQDGKTLFFAYNNPRLLQKPSDLPEMRLTGLEPTTGGKGLRIAYIDPSGQEHSHTASFLNDKIQIFTRVGNSGDNVTRLEADRLL